MAFAAGPYGRHLSVQQMEVDLINARRAITFAAPYAPCPHCAQKGCKACKNEGWVPRSIFDLKPEGGKSAKVRPPKPKASGKKGGV